MPTPNKQATAIVAPPGAPIHSSQVRWDTRTRDEFCFFHLDFDVRAAKKLLAAVPRKVTLVPITEYRALSRFIVLLKERPVYRPVDLAVPMIIVRNRMVLEGHRRTAQLIIDGWHRMDDGFRSKMTHLPAVFLTLAESRALRID